MTWFSLKMNCLLFCLVAACILVNMAESRKHYGMYVWTWGFDSTVPGCDITAFQKFDQKDRKCFTHTWNTAQKRKWLWDTCNRPGREISTIFISDIFSRLKPAFQNDDCSDTGVTEVKAMLLEGHLTVPALKIYALFAASDEIVSERTYIKYVVWYNDQCAGNANERFDGVAVNNEAFNKSGSDAEQTSYLDKLQEIQTEAQKQVSGRLWTHYSIGWHWGLTRDNKADRLVSWNGVTQKVSEHMIDIFDHVDAQVGYTRFPEIADRVRKAGLAHARRTGKKMFASFYTEKNDGVLCVSTFYPQPCQWGEKTESAMFEIFDNFANFGMADVEPTIHFFRGIYSSGGHPDWPVVRNTAPPTAETMTPLTVQTTTPPTTRTTKPTSTHAPLQQTTLPNVGADCGGGSYCKCWQNPPVCHGTNVPCPCDK
ncbi:uncharacterized protein LOC135498856 [Lineus longissimus]|uniref:uncharacterized protein LOC135498856 n=1 Tax=Lineus longissimus TaxID=88925 RepID=UPI002B4C7FE9